MYQSAFNLIKDHNCCKDLIQDIFTWLWERRDILEISTLKSYLHSAVKYKVANYFRHGKVRDSFFSELENIPPEQSCIDTSLEVKELTAIILEFTNNLPKRCREVFILSRNENLTNKEIAKTLSISEKTVENQITAALKKLRISLGNTFTCIFFLCSQSFINILAML